MVKNKEERTNGKGGERERAVVGGEEIDDR